VQINASSGIPYAGPWQSQNVNIPAYSIVVVTLHRNAVADAYSFAVPTTNDSTNLAINSIVYTTCGQSPDVQAIC
jgi:hypothetical protein